MTESKSTLNSALVKAIGELTNPLKSAVNPHFKNEYATLEDITKHIRPVLCKHELALICEAVYEDESAGVIGKLIHANGEMLVTPPFLLPVDRKNAQAVGSAITYARRYLICALLNIAGDKDDDGESAAQAPPGESAAQAPPKKKITEKHKKQWLETAQGDADLIKKILLDCHYEKSGDVPVDEFETINDLIRLEIRGRESIRSHNAGLNEGATEQDRIA